MKIRSWKKLVSHLTLSAVLMGLIISAFVPGAAAYSYGDVDGDGMVTAQDARLTLRAAIGLGSVREESAESYSADTNCDGEIDASDARTVLRTAIGYYTPGGQLADSLIAWNDYTNRNVLRAYGATVRQLISRYGKGTYNSSDSMFGGFSGVAVVRLIDMDRDGTPELYCAYSKNGLYPDRQTLYACGKNGSVRVLLDEPITNYGTDVSPSCCILEYNGEGLIYTGQEMQMKAYAVRNGAATVVGTYEFDWDTQSDVVSGVFAHKDEVFGQKYSINLYPWSPDYARNVIGITENVIALLSR